MSVNVVVGRLDNSKRVEVSSDSTIGEAMSRGGYSQVDGEVIQDIDGNELESHYTVSSGKSYFLVKRVKSGRA